MIVDAVGLEGAVATEEGWWAEALELQTALAVSKMRAYRSGEVTINQGTTAEDLEDAECDFDGYAEKTLTTVGAPFRDTDGTVLINVTSQQFDWAHDTDDVTNEVGGVWIEDASGDVRRIIPFPEPVMMEDAEDSFVVHYAFRVGSAS